MFKKLEGFYEFVGLLVSFPFFVIRHPVLAWRFACGLLASVSVIWDARNALKVLDSLRGRPEIATGQPSDAITMRTDGKPTAEFRVRIVVDRGPEGGRSVLVAPLEIDSKGEHVSQFFGVPDSTISGAELVAAEFTQILDIPEMSHRRGDLKFIIPEYLLKPSA